MGYYLAAEQLGLPIEITGVDIEPQPNYPFNFIKSDAVEFFEHNYNNYTHFHASPPCQKYSCSTSLQRKAGKQYKDNLTQIKELFYSQIKPGIIENVMPAPLRPDIVLRGDMFGLKVIRSRKFELVNFFMLRPGKPQLYGTVKNGDYAMVVGNGAKKVKGNYCKVQGDTILQQWSTAMGIDWMNREELREAIPPAYTKYIGLNLFK